MKALRPVLLLVALVTLGRLILVGKLGLAEDEAYYWMWGQRLDTGYFDHPPAIAYLIRLGTELLGDTERGVRLLTVLLGGAVALLCATTRTAADRPPGQALLIAVTLCAMPLFSLGGLLATPDVPLAAAWALGLWAASRERPLLLGLAAGLAMLSKYTGLLLLPCLLLAEPRRLRERSTWLAVGIAGLIYAPNALWNLQHDQVSWRFQLEHAASGGSRLDFLGAQVGLVSPILFGVLAAWWCVGWRGDRVERLCWWSSLPLLVLALLSGGEANWAAPAYVSGAVGLASRSGGWRRAAWAGAGVAIAMSTVLLVHLNRPLFDLKGDPRARLAAGPDLGASVAELEPELVVSSRYQEAALIRFYAGIPAVALSDHGRPDQFDLWETELPDHILYVRVWDQDRPPAILSRGYHSVGVHEVNALMPTTKRNEDVLVQRWQVYELVRTEARP